MAVMKKKPDQIKKDNLRINIEYRQQKAGFKTLAEANKKVGQAIGLNPNVYRRKVMNPELFTYLELVKLFTILKFTEEEILESI